MPSEKVKRCGKLLASSNFTIAFAESATAGRAAAEFALLPESGRILKGGIVCYDAAIKVDLLGIDQSIIDQYTPESAEVTELLALRLGKHIPADVQVGITGLTTPGGSESAEKPVGTMFLHVIVRGQSHAVRQAFQGSPEQIVLQAIDRLADKIIELLES